MSQDSRPDSKKPYSKTPDSNPPIADPSLREPSIPENPIPENPIPENPIPERQGPSLDNTTSALTPADSEVAADAGPTQRLRVPPNETIECTGEFAGDSILATSNPDIPNRIARYKVERLLGKGGFGSVYLARDEELERLVTIKVPHRRHIENLEDADAFLAEARTLAKLEHPNVVPVHDAGRTDDGLCYLVSRFIDGSDLTTRVRQSPLSVGESVELIATVAQALHYVHTCGVVHRDVKPGNILLDKRGQPYVADFGLALRDDQVVKTQRAAGTPAYMSPEQSRGENHVMDGRSDVFSLGIVLYEMLVGTRPFKGMSVAETISNVQRREALSLRDVNRNIPEELDRICLKALAKRAADRYQTALDFAVDLGQFLSDDTGLSVVGTDQPSSGEISGLHSSQQLLGVAPKGLRSFEREDAHFFFRLLPGTLGRDGVPDSIRFWKRRIIASHAEDSFRIGLLYGPSGCGKSSFVKAGLLPVLPDSVIPIFVEAAPRATETRLLNRLRRQCPYLPTDLGLRDSIARLRNGRVMGEGTKVLLVIDQFEQWLYSTDDQAGSELALSLRQCDGEHIQCIVLVRDDFWLAISRFVTDLEIELVQSQNMALVDLFDKLHARKVLAEFGQAYDRLPDHFSALTSDQMEFLDQAVDGLAEGNKVIPVRLALFAEMVKGRPWTPDTLQSIGGTAGVGVMFLDECFTSANAPAEHRVHKKAIRATLKELLPPPGANIKGVMRSRAELSAASGYDDRPAEFDALLRVLDAELRLITPTESEKDDSDKDDSEKDNAAKDNAAKDNAAKDNAEEATQHRFYQLTHDYLVPAIREWLTRAQRESRRGRAEIQLAERMEIWSSRPDSRHLPGFVEWLNLKVFTRPKAWNTSQRRMMKAATTRYTAWAIALGIASLFAAWAAHEYTDYRNTVSLTQQLATASVAEVPEILDELDDHSRWSTSMLQNALAEAERGTSSHTYIRLALLRRDSTLAKSIGEELLTADVETLALLRDELEPYREEFVSELWVCLADETAGDRRRHNAALVLAKYDSPNAEDESPWNQQAEHVADRLIDFANEDRHGYRTTLALMNPARDALLGRLSAVFVNENESEVRRLSATGLLADFLRDDPQALVDRFLAADMDQLRPVLRTIDEHRQAVRHILVRAVGQPARASQSREERLQTANRRAIAAALLLRHGVIGSGVPDVFGNHGFADARSQLIHRVQPLGVPPELLAEMLQAQTDSSIRQGLMQALGEFDKKQLPTDLRDRTIQLVKGWYRTGNDGGLHSTSRWLLLRWGDSEWLESTASELAGQSEAPGRNWYVNREGHVMIRVPNDRDEQPYLFDIASAEVTREQFKRSFPDYEPPLSPTNSGDGDNDVEFTPDCPASNVNWHMAVEYCNWLTRQEGLGDDQLCYPDRQEGSPPVELFPDYRNRLGFRLPTADEWLAAGHCGAKTEYFFGDDVRRLEGYAMLRKESGGRFWPAATRKPNDYGLFDMPTNVMEWVSATRREQRGVFGDQNSRRLDSFNTRTAFDSPELRWMTIGFRVSRSFPNPSTD